MADTVDAILAFHNAFRKDLWQIDEAALRIARGTEGPEDTLLRYRFFNEILLWHARGEEAGVFPAIDAVAPLVAEPYLIDHTGLDTASAELEASWAAHDPLRTARATAAFRFHLNIHLRKEDTHLYRIFRERVSSEEQKKVLGILAKSIPPDRFAEVVAWLFPLIGHHDRENMTRVWQGVLPPLAFAGVKELIRKAVGDDWAELSRRIPGL